MAGTVRHAITRRKGVLGKHREGEGGIGENEDARDGG